MSSSRSLKVGCEQVVDSTAIAFADSLLASPLSPAQIVDQNPKNSSSKAEASSSLKRKANRELFPLQCSESKCAHSGRLCNCVD